MSKPDKIEALLFDVGGVLFDIDYRLAVQTWQQWTSLSLEEMYCRFEIDEPYQQHERGEITSPTYFNHVRQLYELDAADADIAAGWNAIFLDEITQTTKSIQQLSGRLPCFAFTNTNTLHHDHWLAAYPGIVTLFDRIFASHEMGVRKPEKEAFQAIAAATGIDLSKILFFDDTEENVIGARAVGMQAVHVKRREDVSGALRNYALL